MNASRLSIRNLGKSFNFPVLKGVDLDIGRGEIHGVVGENGAGKSTMVNILTGLLKRDAGDIFLDGEAHTPQSVTEGFKSGVSFAAQELSLIDSLTVAENIALRQLPHRRSIIDHQTLNESARQLLDLVGLQELATDIPAGSLSLAQKQLVEIAKAIGADCRLLILDEPTASLTADQADRIHSVISELAANGTSVMYISHRLQDVIDVANHITVLRDGVVVATSRSEQITADDLVAQMTGDFISARDQAPQTKQSLRPALTASDLTTIDLPSPIDLTCHSGEILGIAGLAGAGKSELLQALFGLTSITSGKVCRRSGDEDIPIHAARQAVQAGIGYLGEDRQSMGLFPGQSVLTNIMLPDISRSIFSRLRPAAELTAGESLRSKLAVRCDRLQQNIRELSGGNQQKVLIARWLQCDADVLLLDEPTRGVDVGTKHSIYDLFLQLRADGKSLVIASSETEELLAVCDRIAVLSNRRLVAEFNARDCSEEQILSAAFSAYADASGNREQQPGHRL